MARAVIDPMMSTEIATSVQKAVLVLGRNAKTGRTSKKSNSEKPASGREDAVSKALTLTSCPALIKRGMLVLRLT